jgi:hypothetical protein
MDVSLRERVRQALPYLAMLVAAALLYWAAMRIDVDTGGRISPAAWPKAIIGILALLCAYEIARRLMSWRGEGPAGLVSTAAPATAQPLEEPPAREYPARLWGAIALVAAYALAAPWLGFFVSTALFLAVFPWVAGLRRPWLSAVLGLAGSLALVVVFMRVAYISLPLGEGPFKTLSIALLRAIGVS